MGYPKVLFVNFFGRGKANLKSEEILNKISKLIQLCFEEQTGFPSCVLKGCKTKCYNPFLGAKTLFQLEC